MRKAAVLFPGLGYLCRYPLLHYTASAAEEHGYHVIRLDYGQEIREVRSRNMAEASALADKAVVKCVQQLNEEHMEQYGDIVMISKSIGTVIAPKTAAAMGLSVRHFLMTVIPPTIPYLQEIDGIFVAGTGDPYISAEEVLAAASAYPDKTGYIFEGCNHSLEKKGDTRGNLENMEKVVELLEGMLR